MMLHRRLMQQSTGGRLPSGYTELEYIENPLGNSAYFDTGIIADDSIDFDVDFMSFDDKNPSTYGCILGSRLSSGNRDYQLSTWTNYNTYGGILRTGTVTFIADLPSKNTRFNAKLIGLTYTIDGIDKTITRNLHYGAYTIAVFALRQTSSIVQNGHGRLYSLKLYENGIIVRDFIPCRDPNSEVGVYDIINDVFYQSASQNDFVAGPSK